MSENKTIRPSELTPAQKAEVLIEALPWLQRFSGALFVVKYGGNAMIDDDLKRAFAEDMVFLRQVGLHPDHVHGLGHGVGCHDRLGCGRPALGGQDTRGGGDAVEQPLPGRPLTDQAGGAHHDVAR